jgi:hypothetical protein
MPARLLERWRAAGAALAAWGSALLAHARTGWRRYPRARWLALVPFVLVAGALVALGPVARARLAAAAATRGLSASAESVRPTWFGAVLRGVRIDSEDGAVRGELDSVRVGISAALRPSLVVLEGGSVELLGDPGALLARLRGGAGADGAGASDGRRERLNLVGEGLRLRLRTRDAENAASLEVDGLRFERSAEVERASMDRVRARRTAMSVDAEGVSLERDPATGRFAVTVRKTNASIERSDAPPAAGEPTPAAHSIAPPSLPLIAERDKGGDRKPPANAPKTASAGSKAAAPGTRAGGPAKGGLADGSKKPVQGATAASDATAKLLAPAEEEAKALPRFPSVRALRDKGTLLARAIASRLPEGSAIELGEVMLTLHGVGEVAFGPATARLARESDKLTGAFRTSESAGGSPLEVSATVPLEGGDIDVSFSGGPVPLNALGMSEVGKLGEEASTIDGRGDVRLGFDKASFDVHLRGHRLVLEHPAIAKKRVRGLDVEVTAKGSLDERGTFVVESSELVFGALRLRARGSLEQTAEAVSGAWSFEAPVAGCQQLLDSVPVDLVPNVAGSKLDGTLRAAGRLAFDTRHLETLLLDYQVDDRCKFVEVPLPLAKARFQQPFTYRVYLPDGTQAEQTTGPGTDAWASIDSISPYMQVAVFTTEDAGFPRHKGFSHASIRGALIANLKAGRFARGASTITMQLAKNLFLTREKTLSRKLEEVILTDYLEQAFTKDELLELYFNVIEFGPNVYGVRRAADHYFGRTPDELTLGESMFLSSILPSPVRYHKLAERDVISEGWARHLRTLMTISQKNGLITEEELAEALSEPVAFWKEGTPRPTTRARSAFDKRLGPADPWADIE